MSNEAKLKELAELEVLLEERQRFNQLPFVEPYDWQKKFLACSKENAQTLLMAANRVGKTYTGAMNVAYHATGLYPDWWEGHKWDKPILIWAAGVSAESTRDILQAELCGRPGDAEYFLFLGVFVRWNHQVHN